MSAFASTIKIQGREIGEGHPAYIIAEVSCNHHQRFEEAVAIVKAAKEVGADAVKLQTYTPDTMTIDCDAPHFKIGGTLWEGRQLHQLYQEAYTPWEWQPQLKKMADDLGIHLFSTPFDLTAVDFLEQMNVPAHKIASFEMVDIPLIQKVARTGKPLIISTGMATAQEVDDAVACASQAGCRELVLLKCSSVYPCPPEELNLRTLPALARKYGCPVGISDHSLGSVASVVGVSLGACVIEKHFTLSKSVPGPDTAFSLDLTEFKELVQAVRFAESALGLERFEPTAKESACRNLRRSLFVVADMKKGEKFTQENIRSIRPGHGLLPKHYDEVLGKIASTDLKRGTPLAWEHLEP